jgi:hypothetical protein
MTTLEQELMELKTRVERLEAEVGRLTTDQRQPSSWPMDQGQILTWLKLEGIVRDPTSEERRLAEEWSAMTEAEKQGISRELDHLPPGPLASDLIIEGRH